MARFLVPMLLVPFLSDLETPFKSLFLQHQQGGELVLHAWH